MSKLQIAVDGMELDEMMKLADSVHDLVDIYEVGTPAIVRDGLHPVRMLKEKYPDLTVLADVKIVDGGALECGDACRAGADIITVLAAADDATITGVVETAHFFGRKVMADLISIRDIAHRSKEVLALGVDYVCVHTAVDVQARGVTPLDELRILVSAIPADNAAAAGGISARTADAYLREKPAIVIMGSSLCSAKDPRAAVIEAKAHFN